MQPKDALEMEPLDGALDETRSRCDSLPPEVQIISKMDRVKAGIRCMSPCCRSLGKNVAWVTLMASLGTLDCGVNWLNFIQLTHSDRTRGLITGPVPEFLWIMLLIFTLIGSVLYVLETINTFTVFICNGQTKVPIVWEQLVIITLEHIPLAAINFFISQCRCKYFTVWQTMCGSVYILFILLRLVWHAHMEGKLVWASLYEGSEFKMRKGMFMAVCALYSIAMAFPALCWRHSEAAGKFEIQISDVNLYLLKASFLETRNIRAHDLTDLLVSQGRDLHKPWVVESIVDIVELEGGYLSAVYPCPIKDDPNVTFALPDCTSNGYINFSFAYPLKHEILPYGEIRYNYAFISEPEIGPNSTQNTRTTCTQASQNFQNGWRLFFLKTEQMYLPEEEFLHVLISSAWEGTCKSPEPYYDKTIPVCDYTSNYAYPNKDTPPPRHGQRTL